MVKTVGQVKALAKKNARFQRRRLGTNACLIVTPFFFCMLLRVLQLVINKQLDSESFKCGCKCTSCCDWVPISGTNPMQYAYKCYNATSNTPCSPYSDCKARDSTQCGPSYSTANQVAYCAVEEPQTWPALLQLPEDQYAGTAVQINGSNGLNISTAPLLYTGSNRAIADDLMTALFARGASLGAIATAAYAAGQLNNNDTMTADSGGSTPSAASSTASSNGLVAALAQLRLTMGTAAPSSLSLLLEPAFFPQAGELVSSDSSSSSFSLSGGDRQADDVSASGSSQEAAYPLSFLMQDCSALQGLDAQVLQGLGGAVTNFSGVATQCMSLPTAWQQSAAEIDSELFCAWRKSGCSNSSGPLRQYAGAVYDWLDTNKQSLHVNIRVNDTNAAQGGTGPPIVQRWNAAMNMASNAFLNYSQGLEAPLQLAGVRDMPKEATRLQIDFSSLLGPLFFEWLMQLLLPVFVFSQVHEKEQSLRVMMKVQGLPDSVYYLVTYTWQMAIYIAFMLVFALFGSAIGLKMFTKNSWGVQIMLYWLWANVLCAGSLSLSALCSQARPAVLIAVIWVIMSGFGASFILTQFVEQGPAVAADVLQIIPSMGLFRGLYELSQYAFLAERTGGSGLTWSKLHDPGCGMITVWAVFAAEWVLFMFNAWYLDQVLDNGMGAPKHPLFLMGRRFDNTDKQVSTPAGAALVRLQQHQTKLNHSLIHAAMVMSHFWHVNIAHPSRASSTGSVTRSRSIAACVQPAGLNGKDAIMLGVEPGVVSNNCQKPRSEVDSRHAAYAKDGTSERQQTVCPSTDLQAQHAATVEANAGLRCTDSNAQQVQSQMAGQLQSTKLFHQLSTKESVVPSLNDQTDRDIEAQHETAERPVNEAPVQAIRLSDDVAAEAARVEAIWADRELLYPEESINQMHTRPAILCRKLRKVYKGKDGNPAKVAVAGLSVAIKQHECFGLLGPNGAGKTTTIKMMQGFLDATAGSILIEGRSVHSSRAGPAGLVGICPQHDLVWGGLTGREHLQFYAGLHALKGIELSNAVTEGLRAVDLLADGAADKLVSSYSGGMKRRLSVAMAFIARPTVIFLDEPSTAVDPASQRLIRDAIRGAKDWAALVLTTHSMAEAEGLCDRIGIFVDGSLHCIGHPQDLTARYGGYLSFSLAVPPKQAEAALQAILALAPGGHLVHALGGNLRMELPTAEVDVGHLFAYMADVKSRSGLTVLDWGVSHATLEEVFVRITQNAGVKVAAFD